MEIRYKTKKGLLENILLLEILKGLGLTLKRLFSRSVTIQYPNERKPLFPGFRGKHALIRDPVTGDAKCVACMRCASVCPARCITIRFERDEETNARRLTKYEIDSLRCIFCGYCEEVCPVNALVLTEEYEYSGYTRTPFLFDKEGLLRNWDEFLEKNRLDEKRYLNPFMRPRGISVKELPSGKRIDVPKEWTLEGQVIWRNGKAESVSAREISREE